MGFYDGLRAVLAALGHGAILARNDRGACNGRSSALAVCAQCSDLGGRTCARRAGRHANGT
jgi:hypothetical protein